MELILLRNCEFLLRETILFCIVGLNLKFDFKFKVKHTVKFQKIIGGGGGGGEQRGENELCFIILGTCFTMTLFVEI